MVRADRHVGERTLGLTCERRGVRGRTRLRERVAARSGRAERLPISPAMTISEAAEHGSKAEHIVSAEPQPVTVHLAVIAGMHAAALAHIASIAEPWQLPSTGPDGADSIKPPARVERTGAEELSRRG